MKRYYVYILTNKGNKVLYASITNNLKRRICEHKEELIEGFSKRYKLVKLVYYETFDSIESAIRREKQIKRWRREWKIGFIEKGNPEWKDLYYKIDD